MRGLLTILTVLALAGCGDTPAQPKISSTLSINIQDDGTSRLHMTLRSNAKSSSERTCDDDCRRAEDLRLGA